MSCVNEKKEKKKKIKFFCKLLKIGINIISASFVRFMSSFFFLTKFTRPKKACIVLYIYNNKRTHFRDFGGGVE